MFSFFRKKPPAPAPVPQAPATAPATEAASPPSSPTLVPAVPVAEDLGAQERAPTSTTAAPARQSWLDRLKAGLRKTGSSIATVFTGTQIDDNLSKSWKPPC